MKNKIINFMVIFLTTLIFISSAQTERVYASRSILEGAWLGKWALQSDNDIENFSELTGKTLGVVQTFVSTNQNFSTWIDTLNYVDSKNAINLLTIEPKKFNGTDYNTNEINKGNLDEYFNNLAKEMKNWNNGKEIWVRFMHEVNGNWYGWSIGDSRVNTNKSYINAYRRIVDIFRKNNAYNVKFIYNINSENIGRNASFLGAYPGDNYVDYVSIDGYNWGTSTYFGSWKSFDQIFKLPYETLVKNTTKPVIIAEFASTELGGDKAAWIADALTKIKSDSYSRVISAVWFNENKETDWRIQSSTNSLNAYKSN
jgi:mannan endo-1,4-beta-mannosidase